MRKKFTKVLAMGDWHCGSVGGLTPPKYWQGDGFPYCNHQRVLWKWFSEAIKKIGPVDCVIVNGDLIDGSGYRSGGTEEITTSKSKQAEMARDVLDFVLKKTKCPPENCFITYGTAYHTGSEDDFEKDVADSFGARIASQHFIDIDGVVFDVKHHTTGGRGTPGNYGTLAAKKEAAWNKINSTKGHEPLAGVTLRSHVHIFRYDYDSSGGCGTLPALQWPNTKYGERRCHGGYDMGVMLFNVSDGEAKPDVILLKHPLMNKSVVKLK